MESGERSNIALIIVTSGTAFTAEEQSAIEAAPVGVRSS